jgi:hypothetical protein
MSQLWNSNSHLRLQNNPFLQVARLALRCREMRRQDRPDLRAEVQPVLRAVADRATTALLSNPGTVAPESTSNRGAFSDILSALFVCPITGVRRHIRFCPVVSLM